MSNFASLLQEKRKAKGFTQLMLARKIGMSPVQLCKIEKGHSSPTLDTAERIAEALDVSIAELLSISSVNETDIPIIDLDNAAMSRFYPVRFGDRESIHDAAIIQEIFKSENRQCAFENALKISHATLLPFVHSFKIEPFGAKTVARYVRAACAVGAASFADLVELLEFRNVRFHIMNLPGDIQSRSFFDSENHSLSIVLSKDNTPERSIYRIAYELAWMVISGSMGFKPVRGGVQRHRFAREFAAEFLMPEESVRFAVSQLGVGPNDWTFDMIVWLKSKFNVSAESFALRLEALKLISERLRQKIREELRAYYKAHPKAMEPEPRIKSLKIGIRVKLLKTAVENLKKKNKI